MVNNVVIKCVAYGALAHFWQINWGQGRLKRVTNIDEISKIVFDPIGVPEIDALQLRIANEDF
ncbi:hypothetical protein HID58_032359 [Brassica napus]|uniref:Uncharacterized protein n=1 Tax=Brassica napus TaxID=3708 RepID=A0ABQ8BXD6_BRANA|nr:hypothetical protein HID58_032359 [Brassica napus]